MKGCIFTGKYANETIDRFEKLIDGDDRVLKIPEEMDIKTFHKGVYNCDKDIENIINKYRFISFGKMNFEFETISKTLRFMKPIFINVSSIKGINNCTKEELLRFFYIIDCKNNNFYPLEYLYRALANNGNNCNRFYIYSENKNYLKDLTSKLSNMKEIFTLDVEYKNILKLLEVLNLSNEMSKPQKLDISYILLDNPLIKDDINSSLSGKNSKTFYRYLNNNEFSNIVNELKISNYPYIVCESLNRTDMSKKIKNFGDYFDILESENFDMCFHLKTPYLIEVKM